MQKLGGEEERLPLPFLKIEKGERCPDFGKNSPDCFGLWVKFFVQNVVLRVSRKKISKMFRSGSSFSCVFDMFLKCLSKWPISTNPHTTLCALKKIFIFFWKTLYLKCLSVFWIRLCFDKCSVICTMTLCYVKQKTHSEFWHIQYCFFRYMPEY